MILSLRIRYRLVSRLQQILRVLASHGFYQIIKRVSLHRRLSPLDRLRYARLHEKEDKHEAVNLREAFEELGPSFVEFGQLLSSRRELIPEPFVLELGRLLAHTRPNPWSIIKDVLPDNFIENESIFRSISHDPIAAGSIAQIHRAILKKDETDVVFKIQRPGIEKLITSDLDVLRLLARFAEKYLPESRPLNLIDMVEEFATSINQELDFILEATYMDRFYQIFADHQHIQAPKIYWEFTSPKVLVMEYIDGIPIDNIAQLRTENVDLEELATCLLRGFLTMIFIHGFFHADPHPGNFLVLPENNIVFIDFGLMGQISANERRILAELLKATLEENFERVATLWMQISRTGDKKVDPVGFRRGLEKILWKQMNQPFEHIRVGEIFLQLVQNGARHGLKLPAELFLLFRTLASIESLLYLLQPGFNVVAHCRKFAHEQEATARAPAQLIKATGEELQQLGRTVLRLPGEVDELLNKLVDDRFSVDFVHRGLDFLDEGLDRASNRIVVGLIIAALIVGSSLIILAGTGPTLWGLPIYGFTVFAIACILGLIIVLFVLYSGKY